MTVLLFFHVDRKEQIEKAEEKERLQKEEEEKKQREAEEEANREKSKGEKEANQEKNEVKEQVGSEEEPMESTHDDKIGVLDQVRGLVVCLSCSVIAILEFRQTCTHSHMIYIILLFSFLFLC